MICIEYPILGYAVQPGQYVRALGGLNQENTLEVFQNQDCALV